MKTITKILYVSTLCSENLLAYIFNTSSVKPGLAPQKFHRLIVEGLNMHRDACLVETLSVLPIITTSHRKKIWNVSTEIVDTISYHYIPIVNLPFVKNVFVFIYAFFKVVLWCLSGGRKNKIVICDVLNFSITFAAQIASKILSIKTYGIVTDLPESMITNSQDKKGIKTGIYNKCVSSIIYRFTGFIFLTEQMNDVVNIFHKPYIVMEGLVDINLKESIDHDKKKFNERVLIYAGGIYEKYGIKKLIEAFSKLEKNDLRLHIYGNGEMEKVMPSYMKMDNRIVYKGIVSNNIVVDQLPRATLLINPRPSEGVYTRYSFPSKNMEYMASGTALVTTPLPGMPREYYDYVYLFEDETVDGMRNTLKHLLSFTDEELAKKGKQAKQFVLNNKNNFIQSGRILELCLG
jgi:glycosyltransferase involved in cell wall biosynthesis